MRSIALAIAAVLLLASCSDDPEPIEPTASAPAEPTAAPTLPAKAEEETPDGAIAFVAHWIATFNFAVNVGAVEGFKALNEPGCEGCKSYENEIVRLNRNGAEVRDFKWIGGKTSLTEERRLEVAIKSSDYQVRDSEADDWATVKGARQQLGFELMWSDGRWKVHQLYLPEGAK